MEIIKDLFKFSCYLVSFNGALWGLKYGKLEIDDYEKTNNTTLPLMNKFGYTAGSVSIGAIMGAMYPITVPILIYKSRIEIEKIKKND